jgi:hypothetical protein
VVANGVINLSTLNVNAGTFTSNAANSSISVLEINNGATANINGANGNVAVVGLHAGTLSVGHQTAIGSAFVNIDNGTTLKFMAPMNFSNQISGTVASPATQTNTIDIGANTVTLSGTITLRGNVDKFGTGDLTISWRAGVLGRLCC